MKPEKTGKRRMVHCISARRINGVGLAALGLHVEPVAQSDAPNVTSLRFTFSKRHPVDTEMYEHISGTWKAILAGPGEVFSVARYVYDADDRKEAFHKAALRGVNSILGWSPKSVRTRLWQKLWQAQANAVAFAPITPKDGEATAAAVAAELSVKVQYLVNFCAVRGLLEDGTFTFPDGDVWEAER